MIRFIDLDTAPVKNSLPPHALALVALLPSASHAQQGVESLSTVELRVGIAQPSSELGEDDLEIGFGVDALLSYVVAPSAAIYAGWGYHRFGVDGSGLDIDQTGYVLGVAWLGAFGGSDVGYRFNVGATYEHLVFESDTAERVDDSEHGLGYEIGAAVLLPLGTTYVLTPGLRFRSISRAVEFDGVDRDVDVDYLAAEIGIGFTF